MQSDCGHVAINLNECLSVSKGSSLVIFWLYSYITGRLMSTNVIVKCPFLSKWTATDVGFVMIYHS